MTRTAHLAAVRPVTGLLLALGVISAPVLTTAAMAQMLSEESTQDMVASRLDSADVTQPETNSVYLFGDVPTRDQIGSSYMVMEVQEDQSVIGALYMPHSYFDCFQGELEGDRLNLSVTNSYDLSTYAYSVDLQPDGVVASAGSSVVEPQGYYLISKVTDNDLRILETCKASF